MNKKMTDEAFWAIAQPLVERGATYREIGAATNLAVCTVRNRLMQAGIRKEHRYERITPRKAIGISWKELDVYDGNAIDNKPCKLSEVVKDPAIVVIDGKLSEFAGHFVAAPGEEPDWDTPRGMIDWDGFAEAVNAGPTFTTNPSELKHDPFKVY